MHILMDKLYQSLRKYSGILIYGAGIYAKMVYPLLKEAGLGSRIRGFIVTEKLNAMDFIDGIQIIAIDELNVSSLNDTVILIAVSEKYCQEIFDKLGYIQFFQVLLLIDFILSDNDLREMSDDCLLGYIKEYSTWKRQILIQKNGRDSEGECKKRETLDIDGKMIVFITGSIQPRTVKIIRALIRKGYKVTVLDYSDPNIKNDVAKSELLECNIVFFQCSIIMDLFYMAMKYKPLVYYFEPRWGDCSWGDIMIRHKELFGKIVISLYDILNDSYVQATDFQKKTERYCLENANGIVWRYFSKGYLEKEEGFIYRGKSIHFLDYCGGYHIAPYNNQSKSLKLCFVCGALDLILDENTKNSGKYVEEAKLINILEAIRKQEDCIFHIFSGRGSEKDIEVCNLFEEQYPWFKVFYGTKHNELIQKISEYDYGCFLYTDGEEIPDKMTVNGKYYGSAYINSISNRFFDYIDAGLPVIATRPVKLCEYFEKLGIIVKMNISNLDVNYLKAKKTVYRENVKKAQKELLVDNQISRLIDFFHEL